MASHSGSDDHFSLFGLQPAFAIDLNALDRAWRQLQAQVHPDRHVQAGATGQRLAVQRAAAANQAFQVLRDPAARAAYLCELRGQPVDTDRANDVDGDFLQLQWDWREALDDAGGAGDLGAVAKLEAGVNRQRQLLHEQLTDAIDRHFNPVVAAALVRRLMFVERFSASLDEVRNRLEDLSPVLPPSPASSST